VKFTVALASGFALTMPVQFSTYGELASKVEFLSRVTCKTLAAPKFA
jgi:hypothetical protein